MFLLMIYRIDNKDKDDPHINLALEEFCLRNLTPNRSYVLLYVNRPAVIIGRHQNILEEVNLRFTEQAGLPIIRRMTGGGTVFHDFGNLNFSFIHAYNRRSLANVRQTIAPILTALAEMGVPAVFNHKNDLFVADRKISGNAQFSNTKRFLVHGTLLFDSNLVHLQRALNAQAGHITSMARKSVQSGVTNISLYLKNSFDLKEFRKRLLETVAGLCGGMKTMHLEDNQWQAIERLSQEKYRSWDWNYGKAPVFQINRLGHNSAGRLGYLMEVENGCITAIRFEKEGTVFVEQTMIEDRLAGVPFRREAIRARLNKLNSKVFGWRLTAEQVADLLTADLGQTNKPVLQTPHRDLF